MELVKSFTWARFPICLILPEKNAQNATFWQKLRMADFLLIYFEQNESQSNLNLLLSFFDNLQHLIADISHYRHFWR